jgi:protein arginine kinase
MKWYEEVDKERPGVVSSRVRLVRNWDQYVFPSRQSEKDSEEMLRSLECGLRDIGSVDGREYHYTLLSDLKTLDRKVLREHHVFNSTIAEKKSPVGLLMSEEEDTGIVLGGTDHIRIQMLRSGLHLDELWKLCDKIDDYIGERFNYAFDEKYGYLTSFPTNVGTGLRASVTLHLPMLSKGKKFNGLVTEMGCFGAKIRGIYGEGSENYGSLYEVSNQKTLGLTEREIIEMVKRVATQLLNQENQVRSLNREKHALACEDEAYKSYGVLKYARRLTSRDAMIFLSQMMQGMNDGVLEMTKPLSVYSLMLGIQPASLQKNSDRPLSKDELDEARADYIRVRLPDLK